MAKKDKQQQDEINDVTAELIRDLNKSFGSRIAYNLAEDTAPTIVKRWLDTGSIQLNYGIRNAIGGGYPEGRIVEIFGQPSIGKSHLAYHAASVVQKMGGLVVYVDTENSVPVQKLAAMGIDVRKRFVYVDTHCTEEVFSIIESIILKAKQIVDKNVPILVIWDSVAASSPKAELDGEYDKDTIGLQARTLAKGLRKITGVIGQNNVTLLCLNQMKSAIGVLHGDPDVTPGGKGLSFHSSVRVKLTSGTQVKDKSGNVIGIHVNATVKKNKVAAPFRKMEFDIVFGKGIVEDEYLFDEAKCYCDRTKGAVADVLIPKFGSTKQPKQLKEKVKICITGDAAWKELTVVGQETGEVFVSKKFYKAEFGDMLRGDEYGSYLSTLLDFALTVMNDQDEIPVQQEQEQDNDMCEDEDVTE